MSYTRIPICQRVIELFNTLLDILKLLHLKPGDNNFDNQLHNNIEL